jgi:hypothetical protein
MCPMLEGWCCFARSALHSVHCPNGVVRLHHWRQWCEFEQCGIVPGVLVYFAATPIRADSPDLSAGVACASSGSLRRKSSLSFVKSSICFLSFGTMSNHVQRRSLISSQWTDDIRKVPVLIEILQSPVKHYLFDLQFLSHWVCGVPFFEQH